MKQLAKFLGYSDQLDARVKSVYLITTLIVGTLLGWLALAVFVLHAYDAVPSSMAIIASFMMIYVMLKQRYFFAAKSLLLLLSFTQMVFSISHYSFRSIMRGLSWLVKSIHSQGCLTAGRLRRRQQSVFIMVTPHPLHWWFSTSMTLSM